MLSKIFGSSIISEPLIPEINNELVDLFDHGPSLNLDIINQFRHKVASPEDIIEEYYDYLLQKFSSDAPEEQETDITKLAKNHPNISRTVKEITEAQGLNFEYHQVTTEDGYILEMHRVFKEEGGPAFFIQHGLAADSEVYLLNGDDAAAFKFAKLGYDVWLGNNRVSQYSRKHERLNPDNVEDEEEYFNFSFWELGKYDAPTQIDYVRDFTGQDKISYMGHSQGTTQMFTALSEGFGDLDQKLNLFVALAPVTRLDGASNEFFHTLSNIYPYVKKILDNLNIYEINGPSWQSYEDEVCFLFGDLCQQLNIMNVPTDDDSIDELVARVANYRPMSSVSVKQTLHFGQIKSSSHFAQFDQMSKESNNAVYGQESPPDIDLTKISDSVPIAFYVGSKDDLATPKNAEWARKQIGGDTVFSFNILDNFSHGTFNFGKDQSYLDDIAGHLEKYNSKTEKERQIFI